MAGPNTTVIDLGGRLVPGFNDTHVHIGPLAGDAAPRLERAAGPGPSTVFDESIPSMLGGTIVHRAASFTGD